MKTAPTIQLDPTADLSLYTDNGDICSFNVGPDQQVYIAIKHPKPPHIKRHTYRIIALYEGMLTLDLTVEQEALIHQVQPLPDQQLLLVSSRAKRYPSGSYELNAKIYDLEGNLLREMLLGDGIQEVQTTHQGGIWVSYFDEGVVGWHDGEIGLARFDLFGEMTYAYDGVRITCCYALNVCHDESIWCCYYTNFPLVHIGARRHLETWGCPIKGSHAFAIHGNTALFEGGYNEHEWFHLFEIGESTSTRFRLAHREEEVLLERLWVRGRGDTLYLLDEAERLYQLDVETAKDT